MSLYCTSGWGAPLRAGSEKRKNTWVEWARMKKGQFSTTGEAEGVVESLRSKPRNYFHSLKLDPEEWCSESNFLVRLYQSIRRSAHQRCGSRGIRTPNITCWLIRNYTQEVPNLHLSTHMLGFCLSTT
jgi:hypothetical protein